MKLFAYPWSDTEGQFNGDSAYYPSLEEAVPVVQTGSRDDDTFDTLLAKWLEAMPARIMMGDELNEGERDEIEEARRDISGFWVGTRKAFNTASKVWSGEEGSDGATYRANAACKRVLDGLCKKILRPS